MGGKAANTNPNRSMDPKQIRARARRHKVALQDMEVLYKPVAEWDAEELARGYPRTRGGHFNPKKPSWVTRELHEEVLERFREVVRGELNVATVPAMTALMDLLNDERIDRKGRPFVPATVKANVAMWLVEHVVGKPTQPIQMDLSVKLQGVLAHALAVPMTDPRNGPESESPSEKYAYELAQGFNDVVEASLGEDEEDEY